MRRFLPALLVIVSAGILVAGLLELNTRQEDSFIDLGIGDDEPSALASPSPTPFSPGGVSTPQPTPAETIPLSPSPDGATGAQESPAPTGVGTQETAAPTAAPTEPPPDGLAAGPTQSRGEPMPVTGGGALFGGGLVLAAAGLLRALSLVRPR